MLGRGIGLILSRNGPSDKPGTIHLGQLGNGSTTLSSVPILVLSGVSAIAAGKSHTLAVKADGSVWAWGLNTSGQLGDGTTGSPRLSPVPMNGVAGATAASGGARHTVVRLADGTLLATGANASGQLGDTTSTARSTAVPVSGLTDVSQVAAGGDRTLALRADGTVWAWGENGDGELGLGTTADVFAPAPVTALTGATIAIGAGTAHGIAVSATGIVETWGANAYGQLGDGTVVGRLLPDAISGDAYLWRTATPSFSVSPGTYASPRTVVITVETPGATIHYTQTGDDPTEADPTVASGGSVVVGHTQTLKARAWTPGLPTSAVGAASYTLKVVTPSISPSSGTYTSARTVSMSTSTPDAMIRYTLDGSEPTEQSPQYTASFIVEHTTTVKAIAFKTGWSASDVRTNTYTMNFGTLPAPDIAPGAGSYEGAVAVTLSSAQTGATIRYTTNGSTPTASSPVYSEPFTLTITATVRAKAFHPDHAASPEASAVFTVAAATPLLSLPGDAYAPGTAVVISTSEPDATLRMTLDGSDPVSSSPVVASGTALWMGEFVLKVRAFRTGAVESAVAAACYSLTEAAGPGTIAGGEAHTLLATPDGRLLSWGNNANGRLGIGSTTTQTTPVLVPTLTGVMAVAAGEAHSLALTLDGQVYAWGSNGSGRLGDGTTTQRTSPVPVALPAPAVRIAAGAAFSAAVTADGRVFTWGLNTSGQLGIGSTSSTPWPTEVTGVSGVVGIAAGSTHMLAVTADGQLYAWGANGSSHLGDGTTTTRTSPVLLSLPGVVAVAAGSAHSVALQASGRVYTWGLGTSGQLGHGSTTLMSTPTLVAGLHASAIAAGANFTAAVSAGGALALWGANAAGQVGDGTTTNRSSPTSLVGPADASALALGSTHALAVSSEGDVWTWGAGGSGRLGDGSAANRPWPAAVLTGLARWAPAAPGLDVAPGTLNEPVTVTVATTQPAAALHYTVTGEGPTTADAPVPASGQIEVAHSSLLRVRAFVVGRAPGAVARADYELQPAPVTITPGTGTYSATQFVTLETATPQASIHYTLDGSEPGPASPVYESPLSVDGSVTVMARALSAGWTPSPVTSATLTFWYGTLAPPVVDVGTGTYGAGQMVALAAEPGATIHYTLDGSTPSMTSAVYTQPIALPTGATTLKAQAVKSDWTSSAVLSETYLVSNEPLSVTATVDPPANAAGWHRSTATVTFTCLPAGVPCPEPVVVADEGDHAIERGISHGGQSAQATVFVRLDRTPPFLTVMAPVVGAVLPVGSLEVTGIVGDTRSTALVSCDGVAATMAGAVFSCEYALASGATTLTIEAADEAGNVRQVTREVRTTDDVGPEPSSLSVTPTSVTMLVGESRTFTGRDDLGRVPDDIVWSVDDPNVATIELTPSFTLTAVGPGTAEVTGTWRGVSASATITVLAVSEAPVGTILWSGPVLPAGVADIVQAVTLDGERRLYAVEEGVGTQPRALHAVTADGRAVWQTAVSGSVVQLSGTPLGGVAIKYLSAEGAVVRVYDADGGATDLTNTAWDRGFAIHPDGALYHVEATSGDLVGVNLGLGDGRRATLPRGEHVTCTGSGPSQPGECVATPAFMGAGTPTVLADGTIAIPVNTSRLFSWVGNPQTESAGVSVHLVRADGSAETRVVRPAGTTAPPWSTVVQLHRAKAIPDGYGGVVVAWTEQSFHGGPPPWAANAAAVTAEGSVHGPVGLVGGLIGDMVLGEGDQVLITTHLADGRKAGINLITTTAQMIGFDTLATREVSTVLAVGGPEPGFLVNYSDGEVAGADPWFAAMNLMQVRYGGGGVWTGSSTASLIAMKGPTIALADTEWAQPGGSGESDNSTDPIEFENLSNQTILVKMEEARTFRVVPGGGTVRRRIDGAKPEVWRLMGEPEFSGDWYKVNDYLGVRIGADGQPVRFAPRWRDVWRLALPECDYGAWCPPPGYDKWGGRKKEPEWSLDHHPDWRFPPQN